MEFTAAALVLRKARHKARLSQRQLAERAGLQQSAIARWEQGRVAPAYDTVLRLVRACGLDLHLARPPLTPEEVDRVFARFARFERRQEIERAFLAARKAGSKLSYEEFAREYEARQKG